MIPIIKYGNFALLLRQQISPVAMVSLLTWKPMFPSYRNQSVDLLSKLTDWFLYDGNIDFGLGQVLIRLPKSP